MNHEQQVSHCHCPILENYDNLVPYSENSCHRKRVCLCVCLKFDESAEGDIFGFCESCFINSILRINGDKFLHSNL